jgi:hypothetical protein
MRRALSWAALGEMCVRIVRGGRERREGERDICVRFVLKGRGALQRQVLGLQRDELDDAELP